MGSKGYFSFVTSFISLSVIGGIFSYRFINSFLSDILFPCLNISILPDDTFNKMNVYTGNQPETKKSTKGNTIRIGTFLKEMLMWVIVMTILYSIAPKNITKT